MFDKWFPRFLGKVDKDPESEEESIEQMLVILKFSLVKILDNLHADEVDDEVLYQKFLSVQDEVICANVIDQQYDLLVVEKITKLLAILKEKYKKSKNPYRHELSLHPVFTHEKGKNEEGRLIKAFLFTKASEFSPQIILKVVRKTSTTDDGSVDIMRFQLYFGDYADERFTKRYQDEIAGTDSHEDRSSHG